MERNHIVSGSLQPELLLAEKTGWPLVFHAYHESGQGGLLTFRITNIILMRQFGDFWNIKGTAEALADPPRNLGTIIISDYNTQEQSGFMHFLNDVR